jgi:hypothetical protein
VDIREMRTSNKGKKNHQSQGTFRLPIFCATNSTSQLKAHQIMSSESNKHNCSNLLQKCTVSEKKRSLTQDSIDVFTRYINVIQDLAK